jgi:5'-3' exonuclease
MKPNFSDFLELLKNSSPPLVVLDFQVLCYKILHNSSAEFSTDELRSLAVWVFNNPAKDPLFNLIKNKATCLVVNDYKTGITRPNNEGTTGYWRHLYYPDYKGGRSKPEALEKVRSVALEYINSPNNKFRYLEFEGYEADDIAGSLVSLKRRAQSVISFSNAATDSTYRKMEVIANRPIILHTVDKDWLQLAGEGVLWADTGSWNPQFAYNQETIEWAQRRYKWDIEHPMDIVTKKSVYGDKSDNLPADTPESLIDLVNPPEQFNLAILETQKLEQELLNFVPSVNLNHREMAQKYLIVKGVKLC